MSDREVLEKAPGQFPMIHQLAIDRILCPVDFSEFSDRAFDCALSFARRFGAQLYVQHTAMPAAHVAVEAVGPGAVLESAESELAWARREMPRLLQAAGAMPSEVKVLLNMGDVMDSIQRTIKTERIDLLVMGTHGHKGFNRMVLGSHTEAAIHQASCPVLVVSRPRRNFAEPNRREPIGLKEILLPTDFSPHSDRALAYALRWGWEWGAKIVVFHVVEDAPPLGPFVDLFPEYNPAFEKQLAAAWEQIKHTLPEGTEQKCELVYDVRQGNPKDEILEAANTRGSDLIVMGARGSGKSPVPWGSVSSHVVRDGRIPVLVVRDLFRLV